MKLYKLITTGYYHHFVVADNPTEAEEKFKKKMDSLKYNSDSVITVKTIELMADEYQYGFSENGTSRHILLIK